MKKLMYFGLAALMLGLLSTACTDPIDSVIAEEGKPADGNKVVFRASLEQLVPETKTALGAGNTVVWSAGDQIRVFNEDNPDGILFSLTSGAGSSEGEFEGTITGTGPYYAFYPATLVPAFSTSPLSLSAELLPFQYYAADSFGGGASVSWAVANDIDLLQFHNALGAVKFTLKGEAKIEIINLYTRGNEVLSGTLTVTGLDGSPSVNLTGALKEENQFVQIACPGEGVQLNSTGVDFYMTVPAGTLADGFFVEFVDKAGGAMIKGAKGGSLNTVERSVILEMPVFTYAPQYKKAFLGESDDFAAYCGVDATGSAVKACTYTEGQSQYAYINTNGDPGSRYVRFQDWKKGYSLAFQFAVKDLTLGAKPIVAVKAQGETGTITTSAGTMKVIKKTSDRAWLYDDVTKNGFVIKLED
jgi:hypothetical protein